MPRRKPEKLPARISRYNPDELRDAPEFHAFARALGILTWGTWDHGERPFEQRVRDFVLAFPPEDPTRFSPNGCLTRHDDGSYAPSSSAERLKRFTATDWRPGSLAELLSRYGLKLANGPSYQERLFEPGAFRETARKRNRRLRVLHGGVDIEPADMDAAKADFLDKQEAARAAQDVRAALKRMNEELSQGDKRDK